MADAILDGADMIDPAIAAERRRRNIIFAARVIVGAGFIILWELLSPNLDHLVFSAPSDIAARTWDWALNGTLYRNLLVTGEEILLGYVTGAVAAIFLGLLLGSYPTVAAILDPILMAIYGVPKIAFGPLFIVWFGINLTPKVVICGVTVFFFIFLATYEGVRNVDRELLRTVRLMGATRYQERMLVVIPGAMPAILLGLKLAIPEALVGAIVGELIVSNKGIGYLIEYSASQLDSAGVFAGLFILMILALLANSAVNYATRKTGRETQ
jgi:NitT/TauT family transport system permease protein